MGIKMNGVPLPLVPTQRAALVRRGVILGLPWFLIVLITILRVWITQTSGLMYDEPITLHTAGRVSNGELPYVDFFEHHSPLPWYILAPFSSLSLWRVQRAFIAVLGVMGLVGLYLLCTRAWGGRAGIIAVVLGGLSPLWNHQGNMLIHDSFLLVALTGTLVLWWQAARRPNLIGWFLVGFAAGVLVLCKQTGILSAFAIGLAVILNTRSIHAGTAFLAGGFLTITPLFMIYPGHYDLLYQGLLGWNLAANAYLPSNPKLIPFINDIFLANPGLWGIGLIAAVYVLLTTRSVRMRDPSNLLAWMAGLIVILTLVFNWLISHQTFGQYYLQAIPPLVLLAAWSLDSLLRRPWPKAVNYVAGVGILYLGVLNPLMTTSTPWTPDLEEKTAISRWIRTEINEDMVWEPWVYYTYLAEKDFTFYYPFLSIHSMQNDPSLRSIDDKSAIPLESYLSDHDIQWVVVHQPLLPALQTYLEQLLMTGPDDWQVVKMFQVTRYASEAGLQSHLWTPWWKPRIFYERVSIWQKHHGSRHGGLIGEMTIRNPGNKPFFTVEVRHPGGVDMYLLDNSSTRGLVYQLGWNQTGHAFFLSGDPQLVDHFPATDAYFPLSISVSFADEPARKQQDVYRVSFSANSQGDINPDNSVTWQCLGWTQETENCELLDIQDVIKIDARTYEPLH
jgi:hypothetical protein